MTIFVEIAVHFLSKEIESITQASSGLDMGLTNTIFSAVGYGRDTQLSEIKRGLAHELAFKMSQFKASETCDKEDDKKNKEALGKFIEQCREAAREESDSKGYDEGTFGPSMLNLKVLLDELYRKFDNTSMLNILHDNDPLNQFRYHMAFYFAHKIYQARDPGYLQRLTQNPQGLNLRELAESKQKMICHTLRKCGVALGALDKQHTDYQINCKQRVVDFLEELRRNNRELVSQHTTTLAVPLLSLSFFSQLSLKVGKVGPSIGFLDTCIQLAIKEIQPELLAELRPSSAPAHVTS